MLSTKLVYLWIVLLKCFLKIYFYIFIYECLSAYVYMHLCLWRPEEDQILWNWESGVLDVHVGNWISVLWKSSKFSFLISHLSSRWNLFYFIFLYMFVCLYRGQKRVSDPLELELNVVVGSLVWVHGWAGRKSRTLNYWAIFSAPRMFEF